MSDEEIRQRREEAAGAIFDDYAKCVRMIDAGLITEFPTTRGAYVKAMVDAIERAERE